MLNNKRRTHTAVTVGLCAILAGTGAVATNVTGGGCSFALASTQNPSGNEEIYFPDQNLQRVLGEAPALQNIVDMPGDSIPIDKVKDIEYLDPQQRYDPLMNKGIQNIYGLQYFRSLKKLSLYGNKVADISPLGDLTKLTSLNLSRNKISDIQSVQRLTGLTVLRVDANQISDITPVQNLTFLTTLGCWDNQIEDISSLKKLTKLKNLVLSRNKITSIDVVKNFKDLQFLFITDNKVQDISPIADLTKLKSLTLNNNPIDNFQPIKNLSNLAYLNLSDTTFSDKDMSLITDKTSLTHLRLGNTKITKLDGIEKLTQLQKLYINDNKVITDFSKLNGLNKLTELDVSNTNFSDQDLQNLPNKGNITDLKIGGTQVTKLDVLKDFTNLKKVDVSNIKINDFSVLKNISGLSEIDLRDQDLTKEQLSAAIEALKNSSAREKTLRLQGKDNKVDLSAFAGKWTYQKSSSNGGYDYDKKIGSPAKGQSTATFVFQDKDTWSNTINVVVDFGSQQTGSAGVSVDTQTDDNQSSELEKLLGAAEDVKKTENYTNADSDKQTAYTDAITAGKTVYDKLSSTPEQVKTAAQNIQNALKGLNGDAKAKQSLKKKLQDLVGALDAVKASNNYKNADQGLQNAYTVAITKGQTALDNTNASSDDLRIAISNIEAALGKLNGDKLSLKDKLKALVDALDTVKASDNYKGSDAGLQTAYTEAVTKGKTALKNTSATSEDFRTAVSNIEAALKNLNGDSKSKDALKKKLQDLVNAQETEKKLNNYSNADKTLQDQYTKAITAGQSTLNKTDASAEDYRKAAEAIQTALNGLNGDAKKIQDLNTALTTAKNTITDLNKKLTAAQQQAAADKAKIEELTKQLNTLKEQHTTLQNQFNALTQENEANKKKIEEKEKTITELTTKTADLQKEIDALKKQIEALKKQPQCPSGGSGLGGSGFGGAGLGLIGDLDNLSNSSSSAALYRLYNPWTGEHLFSVNYGEVEKLCPLGWVFEGIAASVDLTSGKPVYRLYNPWTGDHHYTTDLAEVVRNEKLGWKNEGIAFYSKGKVGVVSLYNPFAKSFYHHYTTDPAEIERMVKDGWKEEGVKWYCLLPANNKK